MASVWNSPHRKEAVRLTFRMMWLFPAVMMFPNDARLTTNYEVTMTRIREISDEVG